MVNNRQAFFKNSGMLYLMQFAQYAFPLITFPYLTRVLGPENYGIMAFVYAGIFYLQLFVDFGFILSATKEIAENRDNKEKLGQIVGQIIESKLMLCCIAFLALMAMVWFIPILRENSAYTYLSFVVVFLSIFLPDFLFQGLERMSILTVRFVASKTLTTVLVFILIKSGNDLILIPILNIIGSVIALILTWFTILYTLKVNIVFVPIKESWKSIRTSSVYFVSQIATTIFGVTNTIVLGLFAPAAQVAYWATSFNLISAAQSLYSPIINSLYPHMVAKSDFRFVRQILIVLMPLIILATSGVFIFAGPIIKLLCGEQFLPSIPVFRALTPLMILSFPVMLLGFPVLGVLGKVKETSMSTVSSAVFHGLGLIILILINQFSVINVAFLRIASEAFLLLMRSSLIFKYQNEYRDLEKKNTYKY